MSLKLCLSVLLQLAVVSVSEARYEFTVRFYEFRNPLGLQCGDCESGGPPVCCDDIQQKENCNMTKPFTCDMRFRFLLRTFQASVDTAPSGGFPYFTPSNGGNSEAFNIGDGGFLALANPFTINSTSEWTGRIQLFIDALDKAAQSDEMEVIVNRFPIDLELELGANFTKRTTYTGIYNISGVEFDMSFKVQCSENYYGPNCTTFCEPVKDMHDCSRDGNIVCLQEGRNSATNCTMCLPQFTGENCSIIAESDVTLLAGAVGGAGVILTLILLVLCVVIVFVIKMKKKRKDYSTIAINEDTSDGSSTNSQKLQLPMKTATVDTSAHDFKNPLYAEPVKDSVIEVENGNQMQSPSTGLGNGVTAPMEYECPQDGQQLDVPNPLYGEFGGNADQANASDSESFEQNSLSHDQRMRKNTFPYVMENELLDATTNQGSPHDHWYQNVHGLCAAVNKPGKGATITMATAPPTSEHNEYDVIERCNTTSSTSPAVPKPKSSDDLVYSLATEPMEGEVYNVAYPVLTPKAENSVVVDGYECLSNMPS